MNFKTEVQWTLTNLTFPKLHTRVQNIYLMMIVAQVSRALKEEDDEQTDCSPQPRPSVSNGEAVKMFDICMFGIVKLQEEVIA